MTALTRRGIIGGAAILSTVPARLLADALSSARQDVLFEVWRKGARIGTHSVRFQGGPQDFVAHIHAQFEVKLGPITLFHYRHLAQETWRGGQFAQLQSQTDSNGKQERVSAVRSGAGVAIVSGGRRMTAAPNAHPLTHWNPAVLETPLFNPETGALLPGEQVMRRDGQSLRLPSGRTATATRYDLSGTADIIDWYVNGDWTALRGKVEDGSWLDYRRSGA